MKMPADSTTGDDVIKPADDAMSETNTDITLPPMSGIITRNGIT